MAEALFASDMRDLQSFSDTSKLGLLECSFSCGLERIP